MLFQKQTKVVFRHPGTVHVAFQSRVPNLPFFLLWLVHPRGIFRALHLVDFPWLHGLSLELTLEAAGTVVVRDRGGLFLTVRRVAR